MTEALVSESLLLRTIAKCLYRYSYPTFSPKSTNNRVPCLKTGYFTLFFILDPLIGFLIVLTDWNSNCFKITSLSFSSKFLKCTFYFIKCPISFSSPKYSSTPPTVSIDYSLWLPSINRFVANSLASRSIFCSDVRLNLDGFGVFSSE